MTKGHSNTKHSGNTKTKRTAALGTALAGGVAMTMLGIAATVPSMAATDSAGNTVATFAATTDKTTLNSYISAMSIMNEARSTFEAWNNLEVAYRNANTVSKNDNATQDDIDQAAKALNDALKVVSEQNLQMTHDADRTKLHEYISATSFVFPDDNTDPEYAQKYHDAAKKALEVDKNYSASKEEVDQAAANLNQAMVDIQRHHKSDGANSGGGSGSNANTNTDGNSSVGGSGNASTAVDKTKLESYMHSIYLWSEDKASFRSYNELQMTYRTAQQVDNDANATQAQVDKAASNLNAKMKVVSDNELAGMNKTNRKSLHDYIKSTSVLIESNYPADRWQAYLKVVDQAYEVDERPTATQEEIDNMAKSLNQAMFNLTIPENANSNSDSGNSGGGSGNANSNSNTNENGNTNTNSGESASKYAIADLKDLRLIFNEKLLPGFRYDKTNYSLTTYGHTGDGFRVENLPEGWAQMPASSVNSSNKNVTDWSVTIMSPDGSFSVTYNVIVTNIPKDSGNGNSNSNGSNSSAGSGNANKNDNAGKDAVDKSKLESVMHSIYLWSPDKASFRSYNDLQTSYRNAQQVDGNANATQAQVDAAEKDLNAKMKVVSDNELAGMNKTDRKKLHSYISATSYFFESNYTPDSWKKVEDAVSKAYEVDERPTASQDEIDTAGKALNDALAGLVSKVAALNKAKTRLNVQLGSDGYLIEDTYTAESWQKYQDALKKGYEVYKNDDATQAEVESAYQELTDAIQGLDKKPVTDKSKLKIQLGSDGYLIKENYTSSSWQKYADALKVGYDVFNDTNATQAQVDVAYKRLTAAINGLSYQDGYLKSSSTEALTKALACASLLSVDTAGMDDATVSNLKAAISSAQDALDANDPANTEQVASLLSYGASLDGNGDGNGNKPASTANVSAQSGTKDSSNDVNKAYENLLDKMSAASVEQASYVVDDGSVQLQQVADTNAGNENTNSGAAAAVAALMQTGDQTTSTVAAAGIAGIIGTVIAFGSRLIRRRR